MPKCLLWIAIVILGLASAIADAKPAEDSNRAVRGRKVSPSKANSPTLEFTMEYIQDKLIARGVLNYEVYLHDKDVGKDWSYQFIDKLSGTYANPTTCQIGFHWKQMRNGQVVTDGEIFFDLSSLAKLDVLSMDQYLAESAAKSGHAAWTTRVSPALYVVRIAKPDNHENNFILPEEDGANHLAKALLHAAELCGSNQNASAPPDTKEPF